MKQVNKIDFDKWFVDKRPIYHSLTNIVSSTLESLIRSKKIPFLSVSGRTKDPASFLEKIKRKSYKSPEEITDLSGLRIITFIESDVERVCEIIESCFHVHTDKSLDKGKELAPDRFGYRSVHYICDLGSDRQKIPEYSSFKGLVFEVQVRTVLQHAWAEIEHDRNYKFGGVLPENLRRRLHTVAGVLELADREFVDIAKEIDQYGKEIKEKTARGDLEQEINSTTLVEYLNAKLDKSPDVNVHTTDGATLLNVIGSELTFFEVKTIREVDELMNPEFIEAYKESSEHTSSIGFLRSAMMFNDIDKYFNKAWTSKEENWETTSFQVFSLLEAKYPKEKINKIFSKYNIGVADLG